MQDSAHKQVSVLQTPGTRLATARTACHPHTLCGRARVLFTSWRFQNALPFFRGAVRKTDPFGLLRVFK